MWFHSDRRRGHRRHGVDNGLRGNDGGRRRASGGGGRP